jgi:hypothetical protein
MKTHTQKKIEDNRKTLDVWRQNEADRMLGETDKNQAAFCKRQKENSFFFPLSFSPPQIIIFSFSSRSSSARRVVAKTFDYYYFLFLARLWGDLILLV